jgi:DNA repair protein RadA/Sms
VGRALPVLPGLGHAGGGRDRGDPGARPVVAGAPSTPARRISESTSTSPRARPTGVAELDRVLGGGLVPGAVVLLAGEPGVGKSTLLLEVASRASGRVLYVTGEESAGQVRLRAERTGAVREDLYLAAESDLGVGRRAHRRDPARPGDRRLDPDHVQRRRRRRPGRGDPDARGHRRAHGLAKDRGLPVVLVGHVTKDGGIAGPRVLEHLVDVVLAFEGDKHSTLRMVRGVKNRFGPADEVGCFELRDSGIVGMPDPSGLFLDRFDGPPVPGTAVTVVLDGRRPLPAELQALVTGKDIPSPRRAVSGLDSARVAMLLAVLEKRARVRLHDAEVYAATVGGMRVAEPAADLALALAVASAQRDVALPSDVVVLGEIGLAGEVRRVRGWTGGWPRRTGWGSPAPLVPPDPGRTPPGMRITEVGDLGSVLSVLR